jgi:hypothetical protein
VSGSRRGAPLKFSLQPGGELGCTNQDQRLIRWLS